MIPAYPYAWSADETNHEYFGDFPHVINYVDCKTVTETLTRWVIYQELSLVSMNLFSQVDEIDMTIL